MYVQMHCASTAIFYISRAIESNISHVLETIHVWETQEKQYFELQLSLCAMQVLNTWAITHTHEHGVHPYM